MGIECSENSLYSLHKEVEIYTDC